jgi:2'-5' RNA ligase
MLKFATLQSKDAVDYRQGSAWRNCGNCKHFSADSGTCSLVGGSIKASDVCDLGEAGPIEPIGDEPEQTKEAETVPYESGVLLGEEDHKVNRSACLMALPDDTSLENIRKLKSDLDLKDVDWLPSDRSTSGPHVTIRFWRPNREVPKKITDWLDRKLSGVSIDAKGKEWKIMGKDDTLAIVLDSPELMELQKEIDDKLQDMGIEPSDYPEYLPHVSVAEQATKVPDDDPDISLRFDRWLLNTRHKEEEKNAMIGSEASKLGFELGKAARDRKCPPGYVWDGRNCKLIQRGSTPETFRTVSEPGDGEMPPDGSDGGDGTDGDAE